MAFKTYIPRKIASIEKGIEEILKTLSEKELQEALKDKKRKQDIKSYLTKCSNSSVDPHDPNKLVYPQQISHNDSVKLDIASIKKGKSPPMLSAHQFMIEKETKNLKISKEEDLDKMLVRFTILDGLLKEEVQKSQDPTGDAGAKITEIEKSKIKEKIKDIEDKIFKIKIIIDSK